VTCFGISGGREDDSAMTEIDGANKRARHSCFLAPDGGGAVEGCVYKLMEQDGVFGLY
jgi:hypothetical protein